jgi:hypothetical protein
MLSILNFQRTRKNDVITRFHTIVGIGRTLREFRCPDTLRDTR